MAKLNRRFASLLRSDGRRLLANTAIDWPDFSLAQDMQYAAEDVVLSEVVDSDPMRMHDSLALGVGLAQGRPYWAALYQNAMKAVELPARTIGRVLTSTAAHQVRPWLVFEQVLLNASDPRAAALRQTQGWLTREAAALRGGSTMAPVACMASASTRNSAWHNASEDVAIKPTRCLRRAAELGAPARVVYDLDDRHRSEWLSGVKVLILDSVRCLPQRMVRSLVAWAAEGGTVLASEDSGLCDRLGRVLPPHYTLAAQLGVAGTWANISSNAAAALITAQSWMPSPSRARRIVLPYAHETHLTVFVLCGESYGCPTDVTMVLTIPLNASQTVGSARLTAANATVPLIATTTKQGVSVHIPEAMPEDFAIVLSLKTLDEAAMLKTPSWDYSVTNRSGEVCTDASLSHEPASENNTRWSFYALPTSPLPRGGYPIYVELQAEIMFPDDWRANQAEGNGWVPPPDGWWRPQYNVPHRPPRRWEAGKLLPRGSWRPLSFSGEHCETDASGQTLCCSFFQKAGQLWVARLHQYLLANGIAIVVVNPYAGNTVRQRTSFPTPFLAFPSCSSCLI